MFVKEIPRRSLADFPPPTPQPTPCRLWQGGATPYGHGVRRDGELMHRWVWRTANGPIPEGMKILHHCDNPPCYRLDHLFIGTQADNMRDMAHKGRVRNGDPRGERRPRAILTEADVRAIRASSESSTVLGARYGVKPGTIRKARTGKNWPEVKP